MSRGGVQRTKPERVLDGIPGTVTHGFRRHPITEEKVPWRVREAMAQRGVDVDEIELRHYTMGPCNILVGREPAAADGSLLWHLTISTPSRHPTWDEIKVARYTLLPPEICFAIMLPPPQFYVNVPEQDHVFQLWEIRDPREPWTTG